MAKPEIRLKGFEGDWVRESFSSSFQFLKNNSLSRAELNYEKGNAKNVHYGDVLIKFGEILDISCSSLPFISNNEIAVKQAKKSFLQNGDIVFADAAEDNTVGKCSEIQGMTSKDRVVSGLHTIPCRPTKNFEKGYLGYYLNSNPYHNQLLPMIQGTKVSGISKGNLSSTRITYPNSSSEQQGIADYFKSLDLMIQGVIKKIASLKQMKQACLVSMFPQAGETTPRVRFKGFKREWVNTKLGDVFSERVESNINGEMLSVTMNSGIIKASENGRFDNSNSDKSHYKVVKINDIAYNSMRMWQGASGCSPYEGIVSPAYTVITPSEGINSQFFAYMFKTLALIKVFRLHSQGLTSDTWNLKYPAFSKIRVYYPKDLVEQQQIASFFRSMDSQISLQEARLEKLKQIKAACLDKMFV